MLRTDSNERKYTVQDLISLPDFAREVANVTPNSVYRWLKDGRLKIEGGETLPIMKRNNRNFFDRSQANAAYSAMIYQ